MILILRSNRPSQIPVVPSSLHWVRGELALPLFLGGEGRSVPAGNPRKWSAALQEFLMSKLGEAKDPVSGALKKTVLTLGPADEELVEFIARTASFVTADVYWAQSDSAPQAAELLREFEKAVSALPPSLAQPRFIPPVVSVRAQEGSALLAKSQKVQDGSPFTWFSAAMGMGQVYSQVYRLVPGGRGNRVHSHSDIDEVYLILEGEGTLELHGRKIAVRAGDLVFKPKGMGLATGFEAGPQGMQVLDFEFWASCRGTDVAVYSEHREIFMRTRPLEAGVPLDAAFPTSDIMKHYMERYVRQKDGTRKSD